jgi:class 3 adenylate cyclase
MTDDDIGGIAVKLGPRIAALAGPSEVLVSSTVEDLVAESGLRFSDRGSKALEGRPPRMARLCGRAMNEQVRPGSFLW